MIQAGQRIRYLPDVVIYHPAPALRWSPLLMRRQYSYSTGRGWFLRKHRYPLKVVVVTLARSFAATFLMLALLRPRWAYYYWQGFNGKIRGLIG
jgi:hypothetical protein